MRKRISKQNKQEIASISLKKIFIMALIFLILAGTMSVMATNQKLTSVKILLSSGYEMDVMTTSTKVSDILAENHIVVLEIYLLLLHLVSLEIAFCHLSSLLFHHYN